MRSRPVHCQPMSPPISFPETPPAGSPDVVADEARTWLVWLASDRVDDSGMAAFETWLARPGHRRVFEQERVLWRSFGPPRAEMSTKPRVRKPRRRIIAFAAAAVLAAWFIAPETWLRLRADYRSGHGIASVTLPDGSRAVLDAGSAIAVHYDRDARRIVLLSGRAWFEVAPDALRRFSVVAAGGVVEDISTAFVVSRDADHVEAMVGQGRVRVSAHKGDDWISLETGQGVSYGPSSPLQRLGDVPADRVGAWRQGELFLDGTSVADAIDRIGRYRQGPIFIHGDISKLAQVNAAFRIDHPEQALDVLAATAGLTVTRLPLGIAVVSVASRTH